MSALIRAIRACLQTGKPQKLTAAEQRQFAQDMHDSLHPELEKIRRDQRIGYAMCKDMVLK